MLRPAQTDYSSLRLVSYSSFFETTEATKFFYTEGHGEISVAFVFSSFVALWLNKIPTINTIKIARDSETFGQ